MSDFLSWVESLGGLPQEITDAYRDMRSAGVVLAARTHAPADRRGNDAGD